MTDELKPCPFCGCENIKHHHYSNQPYQQYIVRCKNCGARKHRLNWTAKAIEHDASITTEEGYKFQRSEYLCEAYHKKVIGGDEYCSHCGKKLDWSGNE